MKAHDADLLVAALEEKDIEAWIVEKLPGHTFFDVFIRVMTEEGPMTCRLDRGVQDENG